MTEAPCLQERFAPANRCFGCGPSNAEGLRIRSFATGEGPDDPVLAEWTPSAHHEAFDGILNGGIIGALLDCHGNWTAAWHLMCRDGLDRPPCTVTADFHVRLLRPTPSSGPVSLAATVVSSVRSRVTVRVTLSVDDEVTSECEGNFVAVRPGHPAYHRW